MQKRILVPLDGSPLASGILQQLPRLLIRKDHEVVLFTVVLNDEPDTPERVKDAQDHLAGLRDELVEKGATASVRVVVGDPVTEIVRAAERIEPELVCMATHGRSGLERSVRGSVAEHVLRRCPVPLFLVNPHRLAPGGGRELRFARILVPLDGSDVSLGALPLVEDFARTYESEVLLLQVEPAGPGARAPAATSAPASGGGGPRPPEVVVASLEPHVRALKDAGIAARGVVAYGAPAPTILETADREEVDLVVMSTHGRTGRARFVFGSVTEEVLRRCTRPLLVRRVALAPSPAKAATRQQGG